jgi:hypothetical protein
LLLLINEGGSVNPRDVRVNINSTHHGSVHFRLMNHHSRFRHHKTTRRECIDQKRIRTDAKHKPHLFESV